MKKFLKESLIFLACLLLAITFIWFSLTEESKVALSKLNAISILKESAKMVLALTFLFWIISAGIRAFVQTIRKKKSKPIKME